MTTALRPTSHASTALPAAIEQVEDTGRKVSAAIRRLGLSRFTSMHTKRSARHMILWRRVRAGVITDRQTLAAIGRDAATLAAFAEFDAQEQMLARKQFQ